MIRLFNWLTDRAASTAEARFAKRAIVVGVAFPLDALSDAVLARTETWSSLTVSWHTRPIEPNHGKPIVISELESASWIAEIAIWSTGEAELATVRLADDRIVNKHYDLHSVGDLERLLDELVALLTEDRIPEAAIVAHQPTTPR
ncbi:hypothetical protein ACN27F_09845 [Solwaraspora sp. WMMB335]|uniref:hypothetical protein n=1 Tax=Solwaraspora sp. WMMB335 TaxID=3404118 RepID=UPI003B94B19F